MNPTLITAIATVIGAMISGVVSLIVSSNQHSKSMALIEYRLEQLERKVDLNNNLVERMAVVEAKVN